MYNGPIIDTHMHLWDLKNSYPWLQKDEDVFLHMAGNYDSLKANFLPLQYIALTEKHHVKKAVHIEAFGFEGDAVAESEWLQQQSHHYSFPQAFVARAELHNPDIDQVLKRHMAYPNIRGIRMALNYHENPNLSMTDRGDYLQDKKWLDGLSLLAKYNLSFDTQIYDYQCEALVPVIKSMPDVNFYIEHFAWPLDISSSGYDAWCKRIKLLANFPNVFFKISGIGWVFKHADIEIINRYIQTAISTFGIDRCMFGSNSPADYLFYSFDDLIAIYKKSLSTFSEDDNEKFFYLNAKKYYRL